MTILSRLLPAVAFGLSLASITAVAAPIAPTQITPPNPPTCSLSSVTITGMTTSKSPYTSVNVGSGINATHCFGVIEGNDAQGGTNEPDPNLGYLGDGLLNGGYIKDGNTSTYVDPGFFLVDGSTYQAIEDPAKAVDPGWIMLGAMQGAGQLDGYTIGPVDNPLLDLDSVLEFSMDANAGTWELIIDANIVTTLTNAGLFQRSYFDQLAFVFKAGTGWAIYDFNFNTLLNAFPGAFDLTQPYSFTGTWNTNDFEGKDLSHMSLWARDPISTTAVPLPGTVLLLGIGLLALGFTRRKSQ